MAPSQALALLVALVAMLLLQGTAVVSAQGSCAALNLTSVNVCQNGTTQSQDTVFIVDASDSMLRTNFYGPMLDFLKGAFCLYNGNQTNRFAMVTFGGKVRIRMPLKAWTEEEWFSGIENIKKDASACCSCCTPSAEAFGRARRIFDENPSPDGTSGLRNAIIISDGNPWQALMLRTQSLSGPVFLTFVGVNDKWGKTASYARITGEGVVGNRLCIRRPRKSKPDCTFVPAVTPLYPMVSLPLERHLKNVSNWNFEDLANSIFDQSCPGPDDRPLTTSPTLSPTRPTRAPTRNPASGPITAGEDPTESPTPQPRNRPTTLAPTRRPTSLAPTKRPTTLKPTTLSPTKRPTTLKPTTRSPTRPTTFSPTVVTTSPTTSSPTRPTTRSPTTPTTRSPTTSAPTPPTTLAPTPPTTTSPTTPTTRSPTTLTTLAPTPPTTQAPTPPTTQAPTPPTTQAPTPPTSQAPTPPTTRSPTLAPGSPTDAPTPPTTQAPTPPTTRSPTLAPGSPTVAPTPPTTQAPTPPTTRSPTLAPGSPTDAPTPPTTQSPTRKTTHSPTRKTTGSPTLAPGSPTFAPSPPTTQAPTPPTTRSPTLAPGSPTFAPSPPTTQAPTPPTTRSPTLAPGSPTNAPTPPTTQAPTPPTTRSPTVAPGSPTVAPTPPTTHAPTPPTTRSPTLAPGSPTDAPTPPTTQSPTRPTTHSPTRKATHSPTERPTTQAPTPPTTQAPTTAQPTLPTRTPTPPTTRAPTGPTQRPTTGKPSASPTNQPTTASDFVGLDLYLLLDRSRSMRWRGLDCRNAPEGDPTWTVKSSCWNLFLGFTDMMVNKTTQLNPTGSTTRTIGWMGDQNDPRRGLRVWLYGFACSGKQTNPIVIPIGERMDTYDKFRTAMLNAHNMLPDGGTCPGAVFERSIGMILANDLLTRPKSAFLFTDGIFYDQPVPAMASKGFQHLGVLNYAFGVAVAEKGNNKGLKPFEIADQMKQLEAFVGQSSPTPRIIQADETSYAVLNDIAAYFVNQFPQDIENNMPRIIAKPYWCGFSTPQRCLNENPDTFRSIDFCKWIPNRADKPLGFGKCYDQTWCNWTTKKKCKADKYCTWDNRRCSAK